MDSLLSLFWMAASKLPPLAKKAQRQLEKRS